MVIRPGAAVENPNDNAPRGKFTFMNRVEENPNQIMKNTDSQKKINATTSTIRFNRPQQENETEITEAINPPSSRNSDGKKVDEDTLRISQENIKLECSSKKQEATVEKSENKPVETKQPIDSGNAQKKFSFVQRTSIGTENPLSNSENPVNKSFTNASSFSGFNTSLINENPFAKLDTFANNTTY